MRGPLRRPIGHSHDGAFPYMTDQILDGAVSAALGSSRTAISRVLRPPALSLHPLGRHTVQIRLPM